MIDRTVCEFRAGRSHIRVREEMSVAIRQRAPLPHPCAAEHISRTRPHRLVGVATQARSAGLEGAGPLRGHRHRAAECVHRGRHRDVRECGARALRGAKLP